MTITVTAVNDAPTVATAIPDQPATVGTAFSYAFPDHVHRRGHRRHADLRGHENRRHGAAHVAVLRRRHAHLLGHAATADVGTVSVKVTASDGTGGSVSDDFDITVSAAANTLATGAPTITGTAQVGQTLTAGTTGIMDADGLTSVSYTYQWIRVATDNTETNISGATASTYTLVAADLGTTIKVRVSFTDDASNAETLTSAATATVAAAANTLPLASDGTVTTNEDTARTAAADFNFLDTDPSDTLESVEIITLPASGTGTLALSGTPVTANQVVAATNIGTLTYTPPLNANGAGYASFTFKVSDGTAESAAAYTMTITVTAVNDAPTVATAIPDQPATVGTAFSYAFPDTTFTDADTGATLTYAATKTDDMALPTWLSFAAGTRTFSGTPQTADVGTVSVKVTASDGTGGSVSDDFDITVSAAANTLATGAPTITGTAQVGQTLTAGTTGIMDADGLTSVSYTYQWIRVATDNTETNISGATASTYTLVAADLGTTIKVRVRFTDDASNAETLTSAATAVVAAAAEHPSLGATGRVRRSRGHGPHVRRGRLQFLGHRPQRHARKRRIITLPASGTGTLALSGTPVTANQVVAATNIGTLTYTPPLNANGAGYASFTFKVSDGTAESAAAYTMTITVTAVNDAPTVATAIPDQPATVGTAFSYAFPDTTFTDADTGATLTYAATKTDDMALPTWLSFAAGTRTFSGTPQTADVGTVSVKVTASDGTGGSVSDDFDITVSAAANTLATGAPTITGTAQVGQTLTAGTTGIMDADGLTSVSYT